MSRSTRKYKSTRGKRGNNQSQGMTDSTATHKSQQLKAKGKGKSEPTLQTSKFKKYQEDIPDLTELSESDEMFDWSKKSEESVAEDKAQIIKCALSPKNVVVVRANKNENTIKQEIIDSELKIGLGLLTDRSRLKRSKSFENIFWEARRQRKRKESLSSNLKDFESGRRSVSLTRCDVNDILRFE